MTSWQERIKKITLNFDVTQSWAQIVLGWLVGWLAGLLGTELGEGWDLWVREREREKEPSKNRPSILRVAVRAQAVWLYTLLIQRKYFENENILLRKPSRPISILLTFGSRSVCLPAVHLYNIHTINLIFTNKIALICISCFPDSRTYCHHTNISL